MDIGAYEDQALTASPVVTDPAAVQSVTTGSYDIIGTAVADSLVRIYSDANNNGIVDAGESMVASMQLSGGATAFTISAPLSYGDNNFLATAFDGTNAESTATDVPTINTTNGAPSGGGGGGGGNDDSNCSTGTGNGPGWMLLAGLLSLLGLATRIVRPRRD